MKLSEMIGIILFLATTVTLGIESINHQAIKIIILSVIARCFQKSLCEAILNLVRRGNLTQVIMLRNDEIATEI
jgi:citrate lyase gamma subunit